MMDACDKRNAAIHPQIFFRYWPYIFALGANNGRLNQIIIVIIARCYGDVYRYHLLELKSACNDDYNVNRCNIECVC